MPADASDTLGRMSDTDRVLRFLAEAASRAAGEADDLEPPTEAEALAEARGNIGAALPHVHSGSEIPSDARLRGVKKAVVTGFRPITSHQRVFNIHALAAVENLSRAAESLASHIAHQHNQVKRLQASNATTNLTVDDLLGRIEELTDRLESELASLSSTENVDRLAVSDQLARLEDRIDRLGGDLAVVSARQNLIFRQARAALDEELRPEQMTELSRELDSDYDELYEDLQDTFRGTRTKVMELLTTYLPDIEAAPGSGPVVDVGCGRGEWLEVLRDADIEAYGIDTNRAAVDRCLERGLDVRHEDALVHLRSLPEGSVRAVTSFHLVEHLSLDTLIGLIEAALLALRPGGILIMETPNPTNLVVGAANFYLDPTHIKPLHSEFLRFLVLQRGFVDAELRFLHPEDVDRLAPEDLVDFPKDPERARRVVDRINTLLTGPADYAVIAHKADPGA